jgi:hypothetical protein
MFYLIKLLFQKTNFITCFQDYELSGYKSFKRGMCNKKFSS